MLGLIKKGVRFRNEVGLRFSNPWALGGTALSAINSFLALASSPLTVPGNRLWHRLHSNEVLHHLMHGNCL